MYLLPLYTCKSVETFRTTCLVPFIGARRFALSYYLVLGDRENR